MSSHCPKNGIVSRRYRLLPLRHVRQGFFLDPVLQGEKCRLLTPSRMTPLVQQAAFADRVE